MNRKFSRSLRCGRVRLDKGKKPYIRKICRTSEIEVWLVDGTYIRKNICEDFVNYEHHCNLPLIPKNEFWIAKGAAADEIEHYIDRMLAERWFIESGDSRAEADRKARIIERRERGKAEMMKKLGISGNRGRYERIAKMVHKRRAGCDGHIRIWVVRGKLVRDLLYLDFGGGGHDKVFHFIPENEIWLDDGIPARERKFILLHELHERRLMAGGKKYKPAHRSATIAEDFFRHHPKDIAEAIRDEMRKQPK